MKKISILFNLVFLFVIFISCEQQDDINSSKSVDSKISVNKNSQIDLEPTILTQDEIENVSCADPVEIDFIAGQHIKIGKIIVSNDETNLYVTYDLVETNWWLEETHLYVGGYNNIPFTGDGNPKIGHFPYHEEHFNTQSHTFTIPLGSIDADADGCFEIIAHAAVVQKENDEIISSETAFGFGEEEFPGNRWGWYFNYCEEECSDDNVDNDGDENDDENEDGSSDENGDSSGDDSEFDICLDAFAFNTSDNNVPICFLDDGFDQWGWTNLIIYDGNINYQEGYSYKLSLYASAFQCATENSIEIGYIDIYVHGGDGRFYADIKYVLTNNDYKIKEVNLYIGEAIYPLDSEHNDTVSPSEYTYSVDNLNVTTYLFEDKEWPIDAYIIPYAKICPVEVMPIDN